MFSTRAFDKPHESLRSWRPVWRNYFGYAELTGASFQAPRGDMDPMLWTYPIVIRAGVAHAS